MKTAMQELKQWVLDTPPSTRYACLEAKIDMLINTEKHEIMDAYTEGLNNQPGTSDIKDAVKALEYYDKTYPK